MNIFIAKLSFSTTSEDVREVFESFGEVKSADVVTDRDTGRSKGYGFIEMPNDEEGIAAIDALNGTELNGNTIAVKRAAPSVSGSGGNR